MPLTLKIKLYCTISVMDVLYWNSDVEGCLQWYSIYYLGVGVGVAEVELVWDVRPQLHQHKGFSFKVFEFIFKLVPVVMMHHFLYLHSCSIQGLSYTLIVLFLYLYCPVFPSVDVHFLPLSSLPSVHSKYLYFFGEKRTVLYRSSKFLFAIFLVSLQISSLSFSSQYVFFFICFLQVVHQFIYV